jgi:O-antigen ligase
MASLQNFNLVALGNHRVWTTQRGEIAVRLLTGLFLDSPTLFVTIETSPTVLAVAAAIFCFIAPSAKQISENIVLPTAALLVVAIYIASSEMWSIDHHKSLLAVRDYFGYAIASIIVINSLLAINEMDRRRIYSAYIFGAKIAIAVLVAREIWLSTISAVSDTEAAIVLHKITFYGSFFAISLLANGDSLSRALAIIFAFATLGLGHSAGVNVAIIFVATLIACPQKYRSYFLITCIVAYGLAAITAPLTAGPLFSYLDHASIIGFKPGTFAARLEIWKMVADRTLDAPLFGHGANTIRDANWIITNPKYYVDPRGLPSAHNIVFDLWFELGVVGVGLFLMLLFMTLKLILKLHDQVKFVASSFLVVTLIELSVDHRIWLSWVLGALIMAAAACILHVRSETPEVLG